MATSERREILGRARVDPSNSRAARAAALDALARRDRATEDLRKELLDKGFEPFVIDALLEQLKQEHLVDDRRYVENFVMFHAERGQGPIRVRRDLDKMGLSAAVIQEAVEVYPSWLVQLEKARQKKFGCQSPTDYADKQRQARFLAYRGFTGSQVRLVLGADIDLDTDLMQTDDEDL